MSEYVFVILFFKFNYAYLCSPHNSPKKKTISLAVIRVPSHGCRKTQYALRFRRVETNAEDVPSYLHSSEMQRICVFLQLWDGTFTRLFLFLQTNYKEGSRLVRSCCPCRKTHIVNSITPVFFISQSCRNLKISKIFNSCYQNT